MNVQFSHRLRKSFLSGKGQYKPSAKEFLLNHARCGLLLALHTLQLPPHSKVGMMVYNCHTVMNAIAQSGCEPVFIDVDDNLRIDTVDLAKKSDGLRALIVTHLFGIENDISDLRKHYPDLVIIEDCAHAFGKEIVGDFGVYSIGQGKLPSLGDGGILVVNNDKYLHPVESLYCRLPSYSFTGETKLFCRLSLTSILHQRWLYRIFTIRWKSRRKPFSGKEPIDMRRMSRGVQSMLALAKGFLPQQMALQRRNAESVVAGTDGNPLFEGFLLGGTPFMLVARCTDIVSAKEFFARKGVETATHFANCLHWAKEFGYRGDCPHAEEIVKAYLMIPLY